MTNSMLIVALVLIGGWLLASTIGTWAYFANEPKKKSASNLSRESR